MKSLVVEQSHLQAFQVPTRRFCHTTPPTKDLVAEFAEANGLSKQDLEDIRQATSGLTLACIQEIHNPEVAKWLRWSAIDPIKQRIKQDPNQSTFQYEIVSKVTSATDKQPFSNFLMHLAPGGQDGVHVHPFGPRNLVIMSDGPWVVLSCRPPEPGEDPATIKKVARVLIPGGLYLGKIRPNTGHGFEAKGDGTVACSIHAFDTEEIKVASLEGDSKDVMQLLTRDLGSEGLVTIGNIEIPYKVVLALHAQHQAQQEPALAQHSRPKALPEE